MRFTRIAALLSALLLSLAIVAAAPRVARAADTIELPAGGLTFVPDDRIAIEAQEIVIGRTAIKVTYAVRNNSEQALARMIAFPLPDIDMEAIGEQTLVLASSDAQNFTSTAVAVDGQRVRLGFEQRATAFRRDITALLEAAAVPLNPKARTTEEALRRLPPDRVAELEERGAIRRDDERLVANWTVHTTAFWRQEMQPGQLITIGLAYAPVTASGLWGPESLAGLREAYCIDAELAAAIAARAARSGRGLVTHALTYSMANSPGWYAPIANFRFAIEKSGFGTLVATCRPDLRPAGPTLLEWIGRDFRPVDDIKVMFIN